MLVKNELHPTLLMDFNWSAMAALAATSRTRTSPTTDVKHSEHRPEPSTIRPFSSSPREWAMCEYKSWSSERKTPKWR
jgi:hypothetical protein